VFHGGRIAEHYKWTGKVKESHSSTLTYVISANAVEWLGTTLWEGALKRRRASAMRVVGLRYWPSRYSEFFRICR